MKWLFKWLRDGIENLDKYNREEESTRYTAMSDRAMKIGLSIPKVRNAFASGNPTDANGVHLSTNPMNFRVYPATGGHIVEYSYYNERTDQNNQALHLIPSGLDLGTELAKIMTLEALKR